MKTLIYPLVAGLLLFGSYSINAQNEESTIVMSEENITSLITKLRAYKNAKKVEAQSSNTVSYNVVGNGSVEPSTFEMDYLRQQIAHLQTELAQTNNTKGDPNAYNKQNSRSLKSINKDLEDIRYNMLLLSRKSNAGHTVVVTPSANQKEYVLPANERDVIANPSATGIKSNESDYTKLQAKLDTLQAEFSKNNTSNAIENPQVVLEQANYDKEFNALQARMEALRLEMETKNAALTPYDILKAKYKNYNQSIFFANNSVTITPETQKTVDELYGLMNENDNLDVVVKGFASDKGNPKYNETLSMQRTEAIKKAILLRGVHPTRVLTQYHGIDYNAKDAASARRVEISFLVRK